MMDAPPIRRTLYQMGDRTYVLGFGLVGLPFGVAAFLACAQNLEDGSNDILGLG